MPRYFFDMNDGVEHRDKVGRELEDGTILRAEALRVAVALMNAEANDARETTLVLSVRDVNADTHLRIRLVCQVEVT